MNKKTLIIIIVIAVLGIVAYMSMNGKENAPMDAMQDGVTETTTAVDQAVEQGKEAVQEGAEAVQEGAEAVQEKVEDAADAAHDKMEGHSAE